MTIGQRIKNRRKLVGLSVEELAAKLGKNRATVYRYESDDIENMPTTVLVPIAKALGTTPAYLMGWTDDEGNENMMDDPDRAGQVSHFVASKKAPATADAELDEYLEELRTRPEMKMFFSVAKGATKEQVERSVKIIEAYLAGERDE